MTSSSGDLTNTTLGSGNVTTKSAIRSASSGIGGSSAASQAMNTSQSWSANASNAVYQSATIADSVQSASEVTFNDAGITVPGSKIEQKFHTVYGFKSETQSHVIVIRLVGRAGAINIAAPVTVKTKQKCTTCGHVNKSNAKFCSECGTGLELV